MEESKIFKIGKTDAGSGKDWYDCQQFPYNADERNEIRDPEGAKAHNEITSIPSPFARIALIKEAFDQVANVIRDMDGKTIYHKMVSDALDVGEIFFNIDKFSDLFEIVTWDKKTGLQELEKSSKPGHRILGDVLRKYLNDSGTYHFDDFDRMYILNYKRGQGKYTFVGATSPATLFFSNANDLSEYANAISFGQDHPFDKDYQPLYKRDFDYVQMLFKIDEESRGIFPEVHSYLEETRKKLTSAQREVLQSGPKDFSKIMLPGTNDLVEVLGKSIYKKEIRISDSVSDFTIEPTRENIPGQKPLVLPVETGSLYASFTYVTDKWGNKSRAPYMDARPLKDRTLPYDNSKHPYLTIGDFLEDSIIKVKHKLNSDFYFDGNAGPKLREQGYFYLLPLKTSFFTYFTTEDLQKTPVDGKRMVEMEMINESVKVTLRIPVKGQKNIHYIEYSRIYHNGGSAEIEQNRGGMIEVKSLSGFVMPIAKFQNPKDAIYTAACIFEREYNYTLEFYKGDKQVAEDNIVSGCRNELGADVYKTMAYELRETNFDFIEIVRDRHYRGILIPKFKPYQGSDSFQFAIDLGTSNTHVEYKKTGEKGSHPFSYSKASSLLCPFCLSTSTERGGQKFWDLERIQEVLDYDFVPMSVGGEDDLFFFPTRTVLSYRKGLEDWSNRSTPFIDYNVALPYGKRKAMSYNNEEKNIKWSTAGDNAARIKAFIRSLLLMLRSKVIMENGKLEETQLTWFYPISMSRGRRRRFEQEWKKAYEEFFHGASEPSSLTESIAPVLYYTASSAMANRIMNIDIGGGTTDVAYYNQKEIAFITSFRFAANDIFECLLGETIIENGIIDFYKERFVTLLEDKGAKELADILSSIENPSDVASFLFSLTSGSDNRLKGIDPDSLDFIKVLQDDEDFKIVFILFYAAIIYHIGKILKCQNLPMPQQLTFSGNGSKILSVLSHEGSVLADMAKSIFTLLEVDKSDERLEVRNDKQVEWPKQATCKGALVELASKKDELSTTDGRDKVMILSNRGKDIVHNVRLSDLDEETVGREVAAAVNEFMEFALQRLNRDFNFKDEFEPSKWSMDIAENIGHDTSRLATGAQKGLTIQKSDADEDANVEETLFFYPIKGVLYQLAEEIRRKKEE